jgi:hypothetical protein
MVYDQAEMWEKEGQGGEVMQRARDHDRGPTWKGAQSATHNLSLRTTC